jgi:hypothetical protein
MMKNSIRLLASMMMNLSTKISFFLSRMMMMMKMMMAGMMMMKKIRNRKRRRVKGRKIRRMILRLYWMSI